MSTSEFEQVFFTGLTGYNFIKSLRLPDLQPARCTNVARLGHLALHSGVVAGEMTKSVNYLFGLFVKMIAMKGTKKIRTKWLTIRLNEGEKNSLNKLYKRTTSASLSEYARSVLLKEPVIFLFRNQSADEFLTEMIQLKKELNAIGNNFNQVVHKLHTLDHIPEIKAWAILNETGKKNFLKKVEEIKEKMTQIYAQWLQK